MTVQTVTKYRFLLLDKPGLIGITASDQLLIQEEFDSQQFVAPTALFAG